MPWPADAPIDFSTAGDNVVVVAGGSTQRVKVWRLYLVVGADVILTFKNGAAIDFSGPIPMLANGSITFDMIPGTRETDVPWFRTDPGNDFIINLSAGVQVSGGVYYSTGDLVS